MPLGLVTRNTCCFRLAGPALSVTSFSTTVLLRNTFRARSILVSTSTLSLPPGSTTGDQGLRADFDKKIRVCASDLLTLVSKTVQYLRDSCVPRRNNVKETDGRRGDGHPGRRDGTENRCRWW